MIDSKNQIIRSMKSYDVDKNKKNDIVKTKTKKMVKNKK
jgi:hypothetical protein